MADNGKQLQIEVVYATAGGVDLVSLAVPAGTTVRQGIDRSGIGKRHPDLDPGVARIGIFNRFCSLDTVLADGDRIEIYRPLRADPKQARRHRARREAGQS